MSTSWLLPECNLIRSGKSSECVVTKTRVSRLYTCLSCLCDPSPKAVNTSIKPFYWFRRFNEFRHLNDIARRGNALAVSTRSSAGEQTYVSYEMKILKRTDTLT